MFKVPDWEDTPVNNLKFTDIPRRNKNNKNKQNKKTKSSDTKNPKQMGPTKPQFKGKIKANTKIKFMTGLGNGKKQKNTKIKFAKGFAECHKEEKNNEIKIKQAKGYAKVNKEEKSANMKKNKQRNTERSLKTQEKLKNSVHYKKDADDNISIKNYDSDKLDELILDVKTDRLDISKTDDNEKILFQESPEKKKTPKLNNNTVETSLNTPKAKSKQKLALLRDDKQKFLKSKTDKIIKSKTDNDDSGKFVKLKDARKKETLKNLLLENIHRNQIKTSSGNQLRNRMLDRLKAAKFRYLNEKLYTSSGSDAQKLFQVDPAAFQTYHEGYQQQVKKWPVKPLDVIVKRIQKMPKSHKIADMGCGEAELAKRVSQSVRSFDLVATGPGVEACDMAHTPLLAASMDVAVYCLALMGTDLTQYLVEANRVLKVGGHLLIAEVESRFDSVDSFTRDVQKLGFSLKKIDKGQEVFFFLEFTKVREPPVKKGKLPNLTLKPCIYKKR